MASQCGLHPLVAELLVARGVDDPEPAKRFLKPTLMDLSDPAAIPGVEPAAQRIARAIADGQPIVIYGDYDVDGITASAILWHVLKHCGAEVATYVPHRIDEGYGLNEEAIRRLASGQWQDTDAERESAPANGADGGEHSADPSRDAPLIVSVDCGITATGPAKVAKQLGVDLIITDHHHLDPDDLPDACCLVHPALVSRTSSQAADSTDEGSDDASVRSSTLDLCGAGVAFKLAWQIAKVHHGTDRVPEPMRKLLMDLLSFVALGTVADVVPLVGENRVLTMFGLQRIKHTRFAGLNAMIDAARLRDEKVDAYHVGFVLGPRLNACGRMGHASRAVRLLTVADDGEAGEIAEFLTRENDRRRATERAIVDEAQQIVIDSGWHRDDSRAIVVAREGWHPGVIGIVASRLVERFSRPVVILSVCRETGVAQGSARSVDGVSIYDGLAACTDHLDRFGGHPMAAGLALRCEAVDAFRESLVRHVNEQLAPEDLVSVVDYDAQIDLCDCELSLFDQIRALEPFGRGNPSPRLLLRGATLDRAAQRVGGGGKHLSLLLRQGDRIMRAVAFGHGDRADELPGGTMIDAIFEPKVSVWQQMRRAELHIKDLRLSELTVDCG